MDLDAVISIIATIALLIFGFLCLIGVTSNTTLAIIIVGAYIGSNLWLGLGKVAKAIENIKK